MSGGPVYLEKSHLEKQPILMGIWKGGNFREKFTHEDGTKDYKKVWNHATGLTQDILSWAGKRLEYTMGQDPPIIHVYESRKKYKPGHQGRLDYYHFRPNSEYPSLDLKNIKIQKFGQIHYNNCDYEGQIL